MRLPLDNNGRRGFSTRPPSPDQEPRDSIGRFNFVPRLRRPSNKEARCWSSLLDIRHISRALSRFSLHSDLKEAEMDIERLFSGDRSTIFYVYIFSVFFGRNGRMFV